MKHVSPSESVHRLHRDLAQVYFRFGTNDKFWARTMGSVRILQLVMTFPERFLRKAVIKPSNPIRSLEYPTKAKRPFNSRLAKGNTDKAGIARLPNWEDALSRFFEEHQGNSWGCVLNKRIKLFVANFSYTLSSNLISLMVSTLVVLIVPKLVGVEE